MSRSVMLLSSMADPFLGKHFCCLTLFLLGLEMSSPAHLQTQPQASEDTFPPLWHLAPENFEDYHIQNHKTVINVWNYLERLGLYKILLKSSAKYFSGLGPNNVNNILWGLPLQHGWQYRSGRNNFFYFNIRVHKTKVRLIPDHNKDATFLFQTNFPFKLWVWREDTYYFRPWRNTIH